MEKMHYRWQKDSVLHSKYGYLALENGDGFYATAYKDNNNVILKIINPTTEKDKAYAITVAASKFNVGITNIIIK